MIVSCVICGAQFVPNNPQKPAKTCSRACANKMVWREKPHRKTGSPPQLRIIANCLTCGKPVKWAQRPSQQGEYCSRTCAGRAKGRSAIYIDPDGRARITLRDGSKQWYARCLMEGHLKRHLASDEIVHHINEDCSDDRIDNLEVISPSEHASLHLKKRWANGEQNVTKLTASQVEEIRTSTESGVDVARRFEISQGNVSLIRSGKTWR